MNATRFSVIIPTHQRRELVSRAVAALASQRHKDFEVIVVDDGSTDGTAEALASLKMPFPLIVVEQENSGAGAARNGGAAGASGQVIAFLDDDMEADPSLLLEHARSHGDGAELVLGHIPLHPGSPRNALSGAVARWAEARRSRLESRPESISERDLIAGQLSVKRAAFEALCGFDEALTRPGGYGGEDLDFGYRAFEAGRRIVFNPAAISYQRFDIDPAVFMLRAFASGRAQHALALKHPQRAESFASGMRLHTRRDRWLLGPWLVAPGWTRVGIQNGLASVVRRGRRLPRLMSLVITIRKLEFQRGLRTAARKSRRSRVVVLAYHAVTDLSGDPVLEPYGVPLCRLERQLGGLLRGGWRFVDRDTVTRLVAGGGEGGRRGILLTFDDGYADLLDLLPTLRRLSIPAVAFIVAGLVGESNLWDQPRGARRLRLLTSEQLGTLADAGVEVGAHGLSHRRMTGLDPRDLKAELEGSAERLQRMGLERPRTMSYPYGAWSAQAGAAALAAGYELAFIARPGIVKAGIDRSAVPRVEVAGSDTSLGVTLKVLTAGWPRRRRRLLLRLLGIKLTG